MKYIEGQMITPDEALAILDVDGSYVFISDLLCRSTDKGIIECECNGWQELNMNISDFLNHTCYIAIPDIRSL